MMNARAFTLLLSLLFPLAVAAQTARYVEPSPGRLMVNTLLEPAGNPAVPLYLDRTGRYYLEILLEGEAADTHGPIALTLNLVVRRREQTLLTRQVPVALAAGERGKTLLWLNSPGDLPARRELVLSVAPEGGVLPPLPGVALRLQLTRKFELLPVPLF